MTIITEWIIFLSSRNMDLIDLEGLTEYLYLRFSYILITAVFAPSGSILSKTSINTSLLELLVC